jgi:hypothetical protein
MHELPATTRARRWIRALLEPGPRLATDMLEAARAAGISDWALAAAKKKERVKIRRIGFGPDSRIWWVQELSDRVLTDLEDQRPMRAPFIPPPPERPRRCRWRGCWAAPHAWDARYCERHIREAHRDAQRRYQYSRRLRARDAAAVLAGQLRRAGGFLGKTKDGDECMLVADLLRELLGFLRTGTVGLELRIATAKDENRLRRGVKKTLAVLTGRRLRRSASQFWQAEKDGISRIGIGPAPTANHGETE